MFLKRILSSITTIALCMSFMLPPSVFAAASFTGGTNVSGGLNVQVSITDLQVTGVGAGDTVPVFLYVPNGSLEMTTTAGLTFTGSTSGQRLYFSGTLTNVNAALATLQYTHSSAGTFTLEASVIEAGQIYDPSTQHMYEVVNNGSALTADSARTAALLRTANGVAGYLANITSSDENAFVAARITQDGWFGASDAGVEGSWAWRDGPEAGTVFWIGTANGVSQNGAYENWANNEPNQSGEEDCSQFYANGSGWNDLPCNSASRLNYYVVEYGAPGNLPSVASDTLDITLSADSTPPVQSGIVLTPSTTSATITLTTDETATSSISYGPTSSYGTTTTISGSTATSHSGSITGLSVCGNTYHYQITTTDAFGNTSTSTDATFVTHCISGYSAPLEEPEEEAVTEETSESPKESIPTKESEKQPETPAKEENTQKPETKNITLNSAPSAPEVSCKAEPYLTKSIKYGANNDPEDVKLLEQFLNRYENANLPVDGVYSRTDFDAVIKWQEKYAPDILKPWGIKKGTGYVFKTSLAKIKEIEESACDKEEEKK